MGNQTLGRGKVYFSRYKTGTDIGNGYVPEGFRYLGNTPAFNLNISNDQLDHYSSDEGIKEKDKSIVLQTNATGSLTCDDIQLDNLALFFFGSTQTVTQLTGATLTYAITGVKQGLVYQIGYDDSHPTGFRSLSAVSVTVASATKTLGTDYAVDLELGLLTIIDGGSITDGSDVTVTYSRAATSRTQVISGTSQVKGSLLYTATNPEGDKMDYLMPYVRMSPNGDFALKGDDWQQLGLNLEILKAPGRERIYIDGRPM